MASMERTSKAVERLALNTRESFGMILDHSVGLQERNVRFAQGMVEGAIKEMRHQAESNRAMSQELLEKAEEGREALGALFEESVEAYVDLAYAPFSYYKEGLEAAGKVVR